MRVGKKETTIRTSNISFYSILSGFGHIPNSGAFHDSIRELVTGSLGLLKMSDTL